MFFFFWNVALVDCITVTSDTGRLASVLATTASIIDISDIIHPFDQKKSSSFSRLIKG